MRVPFPRTSCEHPFKEENSKCAEGIERDSKPKTEIDRRWINGSQPFCASGHARPKPRFQIAKQVKGQKHSMVEMGSDSDLHARSISHAILVWVKPRLQIAIRKEENYK